MKRMLKALGATAAYFVGGLLALLAIIILMSFGCAVPPMDTAMKWGFRIHRHTLERLVAMKDEDTRMWKISPNPIWFLEHRGEISGRRWLKYWFLCKRAGVNGGVMKREKSSDTLLLVWSFGLVTGGSGKSYLHCGAPEQGLYHERACIDKKDSDSRQIEGSGERYKKIDRDWYILEEWD